MSQVEKEIREQPEALARLLTEGRGGADRSPPASRAFAPRFVVIAARGSSDNAARYAQYLFGAHNRLPVCLATPSLFTFYDAAPSLAGALVIGVSQSGQSPDIVAVVESGRRQGALTLAITNRPGSPLAAAAEHTLPLLAGEERAVAATKTYTAQLGALAMLSAALEGGEARWAELSRVSGLVERAIALNAGVDGAGGALPLRRALRGRGARLQLLHRLRGGPQDEGDELPRRRALLARGPSARAGGDDRPGLPRAAGGALRPGPLRRRPARGAARAQERRDRRDLRRRPGCSAARASPCLSPGERPSGSRRWSRSCPGRCSPSPSRGPAGSTPTSRAASRR